jgi:hypothetical protein
MQKIVLAVVIVFGLCTLGFSQETNSNNTGAGKSNNFTVKLFGGYNLWPFGIGASAAGALVSGSSIGGFSFGGQFLFNLGSIFQIGAEVASLPVFSFKDKDLGVNVAFNAVPIDLTFNLKGGLFYTELGVGMAIGKMSGSVSNSFVDTGASESYNMFFIKFGSGLAIPITSNFDIDFGFIGYLPFNGPFSKTKFTMMGDFQLNLRAGVGINF